MALKDNITCQNTPVDGRLTHLFPGVEDGTSITVAIRGDRYSASAIARAVEDCNTHLLNLNVTSAGALPGHYESADVIADLRVGMRQAMPVVRSLERYGFRVLSAVSGGVSVDPSEHNSSDDVLDETFRERVNLLLKLID